NWIPPPPSSLTSILAVRSNTLEDVAHQGIIAVDCPIGSDSFQTQFVTRALAEYLYCEKELVQLQPQCALRLLLSSICVAPDYIAQVVHPIHTLGPLTSFDDRLWAQLLKLLG